MFGILWWCFCLCHRRNQYEHICGKRGCAFSIILLFFTNSAISIYHWWAFRSTDAGDACTIVCFAVINRIGWFGWKQSNSNKNLILPRMRDARQSTDERKNRIDRHHLLLFSIWFRTMQRLKTLITLLSPCYRSHRLVRPAFLHPTPYQWPREPFFHRFTPGQPQQVKGAPVNDGATKDRERIPFIVIGARMVCMVGRTAKHRHFCSSLKWHLFCLITYIAICSCLFALRALWCVCDVWDVRNWLNWLRTLNDEEILHINGKKEEEK